MICSPLTVCTSKLPSLALRPPNIWSSLSSQQWQKHTKSELSAQTHQSSSIQSCAGKVFQAQSSSRNLGFSFRQPWHEGHKGQCRINNQNLGHLRLSILSILSIEFKPLYNTSYQLQSSNSVISFLFLCCWFVETTIAKTSRLQPPRGLLVL